MLTGEEIEADLAFNQTLNNNKYMKIFYLFLTLYTIASNAQLRTHRDVIYECLDQREDTMVDRVFIYLTTQGRTTYYEAQVLPNKVFYPQLHEKWYRLNLTTMYHNHLLTFSRANFRIKIQKSLPVQDKYKSSAYIADFKIHTSKWYCKVRNN